MLVWVGEIRVVPDIAKVVERGGLSFLHVAWPRLPRLAFDVLPVESLVLILRWHI